MTIEKLKKLTKLKEIKYNVENLQIDLIVLKNKLIPYYEKELTNKIDLMYKELIDILINLDIKEYKLLKEKNND